MLDILLINSPARRVEEESIVVPPLGLAYLASSARQKGHNVSILDAFALRLSWEEFRQNMAGSKYDVIAFSGMTPVFDTIQRAITICRPHAKYILLGGPHATATQNTVLDDNPDVDICVRGEGEETFVELLDAIEKGRELSEIPGVITRDGFGPERPLKKNIDEIPFPARDLLPNERYQYALTGSKRIATIISSRGCPYNCIFCDKSIFGSRWRPRSPENVLAEIGEVVERFGARNIIFYDDLFTVNPDRLRAICEGIIDRKYNINWKAEGHVNMIHDDLLRLMRRAGCEIIAYGVESANKVGLEYLCKKTTPEKARMAFEKTRRAGIKTMGYFILGIPVETYEDALNTIQFAIELQADYAQFSVLSPIPGSQLYDDAVERGWYGEVAAHNISDKDVMRPVVLSENWDEEKLTSIVREAHKRFYLRPGYVMKKLLGIRRLGDVAPLFRLGLGMVNYVFGKKRTTGS